MQNTQNMQNMKNMQNMQKKQNMQDISPSFFLSKDQKFKTSESETNNNSRTCLGHLVLFLYQWNQVGTHSGSKLEWKMANSTVAQ